MHLRNNHARILGDVVHLASWYEGFKKNKRRADLFIDVSFDVGLFGSEPDSTVRFKLALKQADISVVLGTGQSLLIDPSSIARTNLAEPVTAKEHTSLEAKGAISASANAGISLTDAKMAAKVESEAQFEAKRTTSYERSPIISGIKVDDHTSPNGHTWKVGSFDEADLLSRPWDATSKRLTLLGYFGAPADLGDCFVRIEVKCHRKDMHIFDIELKDENKFSLLKLKPGHDLRIKASEAYIRTKLIELGMPSPENVDEPFVRFLIADVIALPNSP